MQSAGYGQVAFHFHWWAKEPAFIHMSDDECVLVRDTEYLIDVCLKTVACTCVILPPPPRPASSSLVLIVTIKALILNWNFFNIFFTNLNVGLGLCL